MKDQEVTSVISGRVPAKSIERLKELVDINEWIKQKVEEEISSEEEINNKIKYYEEEIRKLKLLINKKEEIRKTNGDEEQWLKGAKKRVQESPGEMIENCRVYNMRFGKKVSLEKFRGMLND